VIFDGGAGGGLTIAGGTETLTGTNTYTGVTTISSGATLQLGNGGTTGSVAGDITDNGVLKFDYSGPVTMGNLIYGSGSVEIVAGTLVVTNGGFVNGGVTIDPGATMTWANGAATLVGPGAGGTGIGVVDNGSLVVIAQNGLTGPFQISGSGSLTLQSGVFTINAASTYTGATTIAQGAAFGLAGAGSISRSSGVEVDGAFDITATNGGASITSLSGSRFGSVQLGAQTLTLTNASGTFAGVITGAGGGLTITGGTEVLNGQNTYTGLTTVSAGTLEVGDLQHGALVSGGVVVGAAGTLSGHGTILGAATNTAGGTVAPGGTIGTLTVGSYTQGANSTLAIEVSPAAASQLNSVGAASLNGTLAITFDPGAYAPHVYQIVAGAPVSGTFSKVTWSGAQPGYAEGVAYTSNAVDLVLSPTDSAQAYGGISTATLDRAHGFASLVENRFGDAGCADGSVDKAPDACHGMGAWASAIASDEHLNSNSTGFGFSNSGYGFVGGVDKRWSGGTSVGLAFGYAQNRFSMGDAHASATGSSYFGALYGRWVKGKTWLDGQAFYMHSDWSLSRQVEGFGTAKSSPNADAGGLLVQASTAFLDRDSIRPYLRAAYAETRRAGTTETGVGPVGFAVDSATDNSGYVEAGVLFTHNFAGERREARPSLQIGYQEAIGGRTHDVQASLWGGGPASAFSVGTVRAPAGAVVLDGSLKVVVDQRFEVWGGVRGRFGADLTEGSASLGGVFRF
jgi:autotransporter-associated beta strand protein